MFLWWALHIFFLVFHTALILFNLTGWAFKKTRKWHLIALLLVSFSWFVMGLFYGIGFCYCTEWHWQVLQKLGESDLPYSYIKYLADALTGLDFSVELVNVSTMFSFIAVFILSIVFNILDYLKKKKSKSTR